MRIEDMELHKIYKLEEVLNELNSEEAYDLSFERYYPDGDVIDLYLYRTDDYLYITDLNGTTSYWLETVCDIQSDPKYYMIPTLIDNICHYLGVMYQDGNFIASIKLSNVTTYTDTTKHLNIDALVFEMISEIEALFKAIEVVTILFCE